MPFRHSKKWDEKPQHKFDSKYMGGHKLYPKSTDIKVLVFSDRIEIEKLELKVPHSSITNIENEEGSKLTTARALLIPSWSAPLWKKKKTLYTIIEYTDELNKKHALVFDFGKKIEEAQRLIYQRIRNVFL